ncbi:hypothetical protein FOXYSP1_18155 [Fusarium oxysporum f. sp. phaseoli]
MVVFYEFVNKYPLSVKLVIQSRR